MQPTTTHLDGEYESDDYGDLLTSVYVGPDLRPWQRDALNTWSRAGGSGIVEAVTGTGKTAVGIAAIAEAAAVGRRAVVLVPTIGLQRQWVAALTHGLHKVRIGSLGGGSTDTWRTSDVIVSTIQSAVDRPWLADRDALLVADEVHRYGAETFGTALAATYGMRIGLTATLERSDDGVEEILLPYFGRTIDGCSYQRAYHDGILAPVCVALVGVDFTPAEQMKFDVYEEDFSRAWRSLVTRWGADDSTFGNLMADASRLASGEGDPRAAGTARWFLKNFANRRELLAGCQNKAGFVDSIARVVPHAQRSLLFSDQIETARAAADTLVTHGLRAVALTSETSPADREGIMAEFRAGQHDVLCAPRILDEGIDVPAADFAAVLAASKTRRQMIQRVGRIIRPKPDGRNAVFAIAYVKGTGEDPARGGHVAFLEEFLEIAKDVQTVDVESAAPLLISWLGGEEGGQAGNRDEHVLSEPGQAADPDDSDHPIGPGPGRAHTDPAALALGLDELDLRELVLTIFDDYEHLATFDEVLTAVSETHDTSIDTAKWEVAGAEIGDAVTWVTISGMMIGCGGTGPSTAPVRVQMLQSLEDCVLAYQESGGRLGVASLKEKVGDTFLVEVSLERLAELVETIGAEPHEATPSTASDEQGSIRTRSAASPATTVEQKGARGADPRRRRPPVERPVSAPERPGVDRPSRRDDKPGPQQVAQEAAAEPAPAPVPEAAPSSSRKSTPARLRRHNAWVENRRRLRDRRRGDS